MARDKGTFEALARIAPVGFFRTDPEGGCVYVSDRWCELAGLTAEQAMGQGWTDGLHPDDRQEVFERWERAAKSGEPFWSEHRFRNADGKVTWVLARAVQELDEQGTLMGYLGTVTDVSEQRARLDESERRLSGLIANLPGMVYRCINNRRWSMLYVSEGASLVTGHRPEELVDDAAVCFGDLIHAEDREAVWLEVQAAVEARRHFEIEYRITRADGDLRWVRERGVAVFGPANDVIALEGFITDVTPRVLAEREAKRRGERLERLIATTQDAVVFIDDDANIAQFNDAAERVFGYGQEEVLGRNVRMLMPEPYQSEHDGYIERFERTGQARAIGKIRVVTGKRKNGESFPIELSVTEVKIGGDVRYAAFIRDITEQVALQARLVERERLAAVGTTASMFAHEVANPLNNMYLFGQLLSRRLSAEGVADEARDDLESMMLEIRRLHRLLEEFRSFNRRRRLALGPTDLQDLLEDVLRLQGAPGVSVERDIGPLPSIVASSDKLKQVLVNLCKNAIEAMPEGGTLFVRATTEGEVIRIEIRDTGVGIEDDLDVFLPFRTTKPQGTGLGLPVVRQIVEGHGGSVSFDSELGAGTTFVVTLPIAGPPPDTSSTTPP